MDAVNAEPVEPRQRVAPGFETEFPGSSTLATECILNLFAQVAVMEHAVRRWGESFQIPTPAALKALEILRGAGQALPPSVIADRMIVSRAVVTGIVKTLEKRGMVTRRPNSDDGRSYLVEITATGRARTRRFLELLHRVDRNIMAALDRSEQQTFLRLLSRIQANTPTKDASLQEAAAHPRSGHR